MFLKDSSADKSEKGLPVSLSTKEALSAVQFPEVTLGNFLSLLLFPILRGVCNICFLAFESSLKANFLLRSGHFLQVSSVTAHAAG